jgi:hypothetical protein
LFFHPAVWWLSNRVRLERELCCDAVVLAHTGSPQSYAELLVQIAIPDFGLPPALGVSAAHQLAARIRQILKHEDQPMQVSRTLLTLICGLLISLAVLAVAWANQETSGTVSGRHIVTVTRSPHPVTFDGMNFDQWRDRLMTELKPELRAEAITALGRLGEDGHAAVRLRQLANV